MTETIESLLFTNHPYPIWIYDQETLQFLAVNHAAVLQYGYSEAEFLQMRITDIRPGEDVPTLLEHLQQERPERQITQGWQHRRKDGTLLEVRITSHTIPYNGRDAVLVIVEDLTEQMNIAQTLRHSQEQYQQIVETAQEAELALSQSEARFRTLVQQSTDVITIIDASGMITYQSPAAEHVFGYPPEELENQDAFSLVHPDDLPHLLNLFQSLVQHPQKTITETFRFRHKDGTWRTIEAVGRNLLDDPNIRGVVTNARDVTERVEAEIALKKSEERYQLLYDNAPNMFVSVDPKTVQVLKCNETVFRKLGYSKEEIIGRPVTDFYHPDSKKKVAGLLETFIQTGKLQNVELQLLHKDGRIIDVMLNSTAVRDEAGNILYSSSIWHDVTELKQAQDALAASERLYRTLTETLPHVIWLADAEGQVTFLNQAWYRLTGLSKEESLGSGWVSAVHPDDVDDLLAKWEHAYKHGEDYRGECRFRAADGSLRILAFIGTPVYDEQGSITNWVGINSDITQQKEALKALEEVEKQLKARVRQQAAVAKIGQIALSEPELNKLFDQAVSVVADTLQIPFCKVLELQPSGTELLLRAGVGWQEGLVGQAAVSADLDSQAGYTLQSDGPVIVTNMHQETRFNGPALLLDHGIISGMSTVIHGRKGPFGVLGAHTDTPRLFTQDDINFLASVANVLAVAIESQQYHAQANYLSTIVQSTEDAIIGKSLEGIIKSWNTGAEKMYGYTAEEAIGRHISFIAPPEKKAEIEKFMRQLSQGKHIYHFETKRVRKDGTVIDVSLSLSPIQDAGNKIIGASAIARNITALKEAQRDKERLLISERIAHQKAVQSRRRLAFLVEAGKLLGSSLDYEETLRAVTQLATPDIADWCVVNLLDKNERLRLVSIAHADPAKVTWAQQLHEQYSQSDTAAYEVIETGRAQLYRHITDEMLVQNAIDETHLSVLRQAGLCSLMLVPMKTHGKAIGTISFISSREEYLYDEADLAMAEELAARAGTAVENARLYRETKQLNQALEERVRQRTAQLEAVNADLEAFAYSVSHDLRAPLRAMDGFSRILLEDYAEEMAEQAAFYLRRIRRNAQQMGDLIDDLLTFSRLGRQPLQKEVVAPQALVQKAWEQLKEEQPERSVNITIQAMPPCHADRSLLAQVFTNLLANALKYTRTRETSQILVGATEQNGRTVYFVQDNGIGFDAKYAEKVFGVFQRLHRAEEYEGTGVGLATVQRIIHRHGGKIWAEAEVDKGATFYFTLEDEENL